ncbi:hypothetical protein Dip518_001596 [Parelusimicrobium proximum]|uniref:DUF6694 family lipoprotein n=1 Tax=Parelusimicrobium proximum TaxID=3228953 RepID=UPI003D1627CE
MKKIVLALICSVVLLSACGGPKLDGSSQETLEASMIKMMETLDEEQQIKFMQGVHIIATDYAMEQMTEAFAAAFGEGEVDEEALKSKAQNDLLKRFHNKTYKQIVSESEKIIKKYEGMEDEADEDIEVETVEAE